MTSLAWHENVTANEHRHTAVSWARRTLRPSVAVIIGLETTTPGTGAFIGKVGIRTCGIGHELVLRWIRNPQAAVGIR